MRTKIVAQKDPKLPAPLGGLDGPQWTSTLKQFDVLAAETLCAAIQTLYPHDALPEHVYRRVVVMFDALVSESTANAALIREFVQQLNADFPVPFVDRSEGYRTQALQATQSSPAFRFVQRTSVRYLYDDVEVWQAFGYEGASIHMGGYVDRGFDDLDWLPPVPLTQHR